MFSSRLVHRTARAGLVATFALALASLAAVPAALAQGELAARWLDCAPDGVLNLAPTCQSNVGERRLLLSLTPGADVDQVVGWTLVVDLASDAASLPDWWQVQPSGCRAGEISATTPSGFENNCIDVWSTTGSAVLQSGLYPRPGGDGRQLRLILGVGVPAAGAFSLTAGEIYLAGVVSLRFGKTAPPGECVGCSQPVCLVFNSAEIARLPGAPGPDPQPFVTPSPSFGNQATWGGGSSCAIVPVRARTWGQIKSLYQ